MAGGRVKRAVQRRALVVRSPGWLAGYLYGSRARQQLEIIDEIISLAGLPASDLHYRQRARLDKWPARCRYCAHFEPVRVGEPR